MTMTSPYLDEASTRALPSATDRLAALRTEQAALLEQKAAAKKALGEAVAAGVSADEYAQARDTMRAAADRLAAIDAAIPLLEPEAAREQEEAAARRSAELTRASEALDLRVHASALALEQLAYTFARDVFRPAYEANEALYARGRGAFLAAARANGRDPWASDYNPLQGIGHRFREAGFGDLAVMLAAYATRPAFTPHDAG